MTSSPLKFAIENQTAVIKLNRPQVHHAMDDGMMRALEIALDEIENNDNIRTIVLSATGNTTFCAGGDLRYFASLKKRSDCLVMSERMQQIMTRIHSGDRPAIAAVNGQALGGGCEILTACHIRMAASHATFSFRQAPNGILTGWGGGGRLFRIIGKAKALKLLLSGETITANDALNIGLVDQVVRGEALLSSARALADKINQNPPPAVKAFIALSQNYDVLDEEQLKAFETETFADLWMGEHFQNILKKFRS